jgi:hypothetical protein
MPKRIYTDAADLLSCAIDLAIESLSNYPPAGWHDSQIQHFINVYTQEKTDVLNPQAKFNNIKSLKYIEEVVFTYFQESSGAAVEHFWKQIRLQKLPYKRQNKMAKILKKHKITNQIEYDFVTDTMVCYLQDELISKAEALQFNNYLLAYEDKLSKKKL